MKEILSFLHQKDFVSLELILEREVNNINLSFQPMKNIFTGYISNDDLVTVAGKGYLHCLDFFLQFDVDINYLNQDSFSPLIIASRNGCYKVVERLLEAGAEIDKPDEDGLTALRYAVLFEHSDISKLLLEKGANVNQRDRFRWTPLLSAVANNNQHLTELLLANGANPQLKTRQGEYPLIKAIYNKNNRIVKLLAENNADLNVKDMRYNYPSVFLVIDTGDIEMLKILVENGANIEIRGAYFNETILMRAVSLRYKNMVSYILSKQVNINAVDNNGWSALFYAVENNDLDIVKLLIDNGVDFSIRDNNQETALSLWSWKIDETLKSYLTDKY